MPVRYQLRLTFILWIASIWGCASWSAPQSAELPIARIPHDSIMLEAAFLRLDQAANLPEIWRDVDEQQLSAEVRRRLAANGIRAGLVGIQLPTSLQAILDSQQQDQQLTSGDSFLATRLTGLQQQITLRAGERSELVVVPELDPQVVLVNDEGNIRGTPFQQGQALFEIRAHPSGDTTVRLEMTPEIKHGQIKQQYVPGNGTLLYDVGREVHAFENLRFEAVLSPGQTLLIAATPDAKGVGSLLFSRDSSEKDEQLLLLIRLAQTQYDDLFSAPQTLQPLATPLE